MTNEARKGLRSFAELYERNKDGVSREISKIKDETRGGARKGVGHPRQMEDGRRINVYLDAESIEKAKNLGNGNLSEGIRKAIKLLDAESVPVALPVAVG